MIRPFPTYTSYWEGVEFCNCLYMNQSLAQLENAEICSQILFWYVTSYGTNVLIISQRLNIEWYTTEFATLNALEKYLEGEKTIPYPLEPDGLVYKDFIQQLTYKYNGHILQPSCKLSFMKLAHYYWWEIINSVVTKMCLFIKWAGTVSIH